MTLNPRLGMRDSSIDTSDDIKFECSQCGQHILVERSAAGFTVGCPGCQHPVTVPPPNTLVESSDRDVRASEPAPHVHAGPRTESPLTLGVELEEARAETARQHALLRKAVDECERVKANATHVQAELKSFQADRQQLKADVALTRQAALAAEARASELAAALAAAQQENTDLRGQIGGEINGLQGRLVAQEQVLHERESQLGQALRNLGKAKSELAASVVEVTGLRSELQAHRHGLEATGQQLTVARTDLHEAVSRLAVLTEEHRAASEQRDEWKQRAEGFERDLTFIDSGRDLLELRERFKQLQLDCRALEIKLAERTEEAEKNNSALKGIVARQNTTLGVYHSELRRLRRARFAVRLVYGCFFLGLLALGFFACKIFGPGHFAEIFGQLKHVKGGGF